MTATTEFANVDRARTERAHMTDGARMIARAAQRVIGAALVLAAIGIWVAPGATWESDVMLFKLVLSMSALLAGLGLIQSSASPEAPEVEIDTIRREVRLLRPGVDGPAALLERCTFDALTRAEQRGSHVRLWGADGKLIVETTVPDRKALSSLVHGLQDAGKLA